MPILQNFHLCSALHHSAQHDNAMLLSAPLAPPALSPIVAPPFFPPNSGQVTEPNSGYETLYVSLDNVQVGQSAGDDGCLGAVSTSTNPNAIPALLQPGASATIQLTVDSKDGEYDGG